jgi:predicted transcriptional regulator YdeE
MKVEFKTWPAFTSVGLKQRASGGERLGELWGRFVPRMGEVPHQTGSDEAYGLMDNFELDKDGNTLGFDYLAALPVTEVDELPESMESWVVPEGFYAALTVRFGELMDGFDYLAHTWLPESGYEYNFDLPEIEYYPPGFNPDDERATVEILMPVREK